MFKIDTNSATISLIERRDPTLDDINVDLEEQAKQGLFDSVNRIRELIGDCQSWAGEYQLGVSHCFIPYEKTDCGELPELTHVEDWTGQVDGKCSSCGKSFHLTYEEIGLKTR